MKKIIYGFATLLLSVFTINANADVTVVGTYNGWTEAGSQYFSGMVNNGDKVDVTANEGGTVKVVYTSTTWGTATFDTVSVSADENGFSFAEAEGTSLMAGMGGQAREYAAILTGATMSNNKQSYTFTISIPAVMGGTTVVFKEGSAPINKLIAGTYNGWTNASSTYFSDRTNDGDKVEITATENGTIKVVYTSTEWGTATFEGVTIVENDEDYELEEANGTIEMQSMGGGMNEYDAVLSTASINKEGETFNFTFSVPAVMGGVSLVFQDGTAPEEPEAINNVTAEKFRFEMGNLFLTNGHSGETIRVFSSNGQLIKTINADNNGAVNINLKSMAKGIYIVKAEQASIKVLNK